jgi:ketosteroid isomerase-like protein
MIGMKTYLVVPALVSVIMTGLISAADTTSSIEQALRDLDAQWAAAATAKDVDKTVSFYADDAVVFPSNAPSVSTKATIKTLWKDMIASAANESWKSTKVEVAKSGDMAWVSGTYEVTMKNASGKPVTERGKYLEVWEKQGDGQWKCGADMWNSDAPTSTSAPAEKK